MVPLKRAPFKQQIAAGESQVCGEAKTLKSFIGSKTPNTKQQQSPTINYV